MSDLPPPPPGAVPMALPPPPPGAVPFPAPPAGAVPFAAAPQYTAQSPFVVDPKTVTPEAFAEWRAANPGAYVKMPDGRVLRVPAPTPEEVAEKQAAAYDTSGLEDAGPSTLGSFGRNVIGGMVPAAGGMVGMGAGAQLGAALGAPLAPVTAGLSIPIGGVVGAIAGGLGGGYLAGQAQDVALAQVPPVQKFLGQDPETRQADEAAHPYASFAGRILPQAAFLRPSFPGHAVPEGASAAQRILGSRATGPVVGGAFGAGQEAITEAVTEGHVDPVKVGIAGAAGAAMTKPTAAGQSLIMAGARPVQAGIEKIAPGLGARVQPPPPPGAAPTERQPVGSVWDIVPDAAQGETPVRMTVWGYTEDGMVILRSEDGQTSYTTTPEVVATFGKPVAPPTSPSDLPALTAPPRALPPPATGYGEGFTMRPPGAPEAGPGETTRTEFAPENVPPVEPPRAQSDPFAGIDQDIGPAGPREPPPRAPEGIEQQDADLRAAVAEGRPTSPDPVGERLAEVQKEIAPDQTAVPRGTVAETPPAPEANKATELSGALGAMGRGMTDSLYNDLFAGLGGARNTVARMETALMARLKPFYDAGVIKSPEDIRALVQAGYDPERAGLRPPAAPEGGAPAEPPTPEPQAPAPRSLEAQDSRPAPPVAPEQPRSMPPDVRDQLLQDAIKDIQADEIFGARVRGDETQLRRYIDGWNEGFDAEMAGQDIRLSMSTSSRALGRNDGVDAAEKYNRENRQLAAPEPAPPVERPAEPVAETPVPHDEAVRWAETVPFDEVDRSDAQRMLNVYRDDKGIQEMVRRIAQGERWQDLYHEIKTPLTAFETRGLAEITPREPAVPPTEARPEAPLPNTDESKNQPTVTEGKHTKTGKDIVTVQLKEKVGTDEFKALGAEARKLGGYYSSYRGNGAIPGFIFKDRETADRFADIVRGEKPAEQALVPRGTPEPLAPDEHPGLVIKSLETGKTTELQPRGTRQPSQWNEIGKNSDGQKLYEDQRGVRSIVENGVRRTEPVGMRPTRGGTEVTTDRISHPEYEVSAEQPSLPARVTPQVEPLPGSGPLGLRSTESLPTAPEAPTSPERGLETEDGVQEPVRARDARAGPEDVPGPGEARPDRAAPGPEERGGARDAAAAPGAAPEPRARGETRGRGDRAPDADRVPAGETGAGERGAAGRPAPVLDLAEAGQEVAAPRPQGRDIDLGTRKPKAPEAAGRDVDLIRGENFVIEPGAVEEARSPRQKARDNISAIELAKTIADEGRAATREEQATLAKYVGWGGLSGAFPDAKGQLRKGFEDIGARLRDLLTPDQYRTAARSTQYAHYTSEPVIRSMWNAVERLGFKGGTVLEPGMGVGHFLGMMPRDLSAASKYQGLELDHVTSMIAKLLYPQSGVRQADFTRTPMPRDTFDLAIGNPPFGDIVIKSDPKYAARNFLLHDYFFAKSLDSVRPGGLLAFVTSAGTMNKMDSGPRRFMAERAEFLGGVRLPSTAFAKNAGTEVTTDILFFKKRPFGPVDLGDKAPEWTETVFRKLPNSKGEIVENPVNRYFSEHPEMVLGEEGFFDKLYKDRYAVHARPGEELEPALRSAFERLPENVMEPPPSPEQKAALDFSTAETKDGSYYTGKDGRLMQYDGGVGRPVQKRGAGVEGGKTSAEIETIRSLLPVRDSLREVFKADLAGDAAAGAKARAALNKTYDAFVAKNGPLNKTERAYRRPNIIQQEAARNEAREDARELGMPWREGDFDPTAMIAARAKVGEIARARQEARDRAIREGREFDEGSFDPEDMPDIVIEKRPNIDPFSDDQESYRLRALEDYDDRAGTAEKRRIFSENVLTREEDPKLNSAHDGILWSVNKFGRLDLDAVSEKLGQSKDKIIAELGDSVMRLPGTEEAFVPKDAYLSGDVVTKLAEARAAAERDPRFQANVTALEEAQPKPLSPAEISINIGMPWIPQETMLEFVDHLGIGKVGIEYSPLMGRWNVDFRNARYGENRAQFSTDDMSAHQILSDVMNRISPVIRRTERQPDGSARTYVDPVATQAAQDKAALIKQEFQDWVQQDPERADGLAQLYNDKYNRVVLRNWNGDYLTTPGISKEWKWRPHQTRVVARIIQDGNTYMAHAVGAGKTSAMIGAGMEMRRLGLVSKPMYVVPNHMLGQFAKEFYEQYPTARIRVADDRNFHTSRRKQFVADVAQQDLDAIIITNSAFKKIPIGAEFQERMIREQIDEIDDALASLDERENRITVKDLQKRKERLEQQLSRGVGDQDTVNTFEELGVDFLFVDEAHQFRKLSFVTQTPMKGITSQGSDMAWDLYTKIRYLDENRPARSVVMASGTPVTNTMGELYTLSKFMQPAALRERGLSHFDSWAQSFGDTKTEIEQTAQGTYESVTRFAKFVNIPELYKMVGSVMDVVTETELGRYVTRPALKGGERQFHLAPRTPWLEEFQQQLGKRVEAIKQRGGRPAPGEDILLSVITDGRKGAIDPRLIDPSLPNDPSSKLNQMIDNVFGIWKETKNQKFYDPATGYQKEAFRGPATQMVFANYGINARDSAGNPTFSTYQWIKRELIRKGVPANEIAFIRDAKTPVDKQRLFNDMNEGKIRILVGSVQKMGTGVNAQRRLAAIHNMDPLWYPADDTQRNGRGLRQGNFNPEIAIHDYSTKGTYDATMWAMMGRKGRFIEQFFRGDPALRDMEDLGEAGQYEQASAMSTADPRVIQLTEMKQELQKLERRQMAHENEQYSYRARAAREQEYAQRSAQQAENAAGAIEKIEDISGDKFAMEVAGKKYTDRKKAADAVEATVKEMTEYMQSGQQAKFGSIGGFPLRLQAYKDFNGKTNAGLFIDLWGKGGDYPVSWQGSGAGMIQSAAGRIRDLPSARDAFRQQAEQAQKRYESNRREIGKAFPDADKIRPMREQVRNLEAELSKRPEKVGPEAEAEGPQDSTLSRLMRDESGSGWNPFSSRRDYADQVERDAIDEAIGPPNVPRGPGWSERFFNVLGAGPKSPGKNEHWFNPVNKWFTAASNAARYDFGGVSAQKWQAENARRDDAHRLSSSYIEMMPTFLDASPKLAQKLTAVFELERLQGRATPIDGRSIVAVNAAAASEGDPLASQPNAAHSKPGQTLKLTTPEEIKAYGEVRRMLDKAWSDYAKATAERYGWEGEPTSKAIMEAAEQATGREARRLTQVAKMVGAVEYSRRNAYVPFMRFGDYFFHVLPKEGTPGWNGEGKRPTAWFGLIDSRLPEEKMLGGRRQGSLTAKTERARLEQQFDPDLYEIREGYWTPTEDSLRSIGIPAIEKLFTLIGNDSDKAWRAKVKGAEVVEHPSGQGFAIRFPDGEFARAKASGKTPGEIMKWDRAEDANVRAVAAEARDMQEKAIQSLLDEVYAEMAAGFKKRSQNVPGYDPDLTRSLGIYTNWIASNVADMRHRDAIDAANLKVDNSYDPNTRQYWRDREAYLDRERDGILENAGRAARNAAYYWYLGLNLASTMKNTLDGPMVHLPALTTVFDGVNKAQAAAAYLNAAKDVLKTFHIGEHGLDVKPMNAAKTPAERALVQDSERSGLLNPRGARELGALASEGIESLTPRQKFARRALEIWGSNMSSTDRLMRTSMLLAAHRIANKVGMERINRTWGKDKSWAAVANKTPEEWARFMVKRVAGEFGEHNRLPVMRNEAGAFYGQFQSYSLNYLSTIYQLMKQMGPEGRAAGAMMLAGMALTSGITAIPFVTAAMATAEMVYNWFADIDVDLKSEIARAIEAMGFGEIAGEIALHGFSRSVLGVDLGSLDVTGFLNDIGGRSDWGIEGLGPAFGLIGAARKASNRRAHGESAAAIAAEVMPTPAKNMVKSLIVYPEQGVRTLRGGPNAQVLTPDQIGTREQVVAAVGLPSAKLARAYEQREFARRAGELAKKPTIDLNKMLVGLYARAAFAERRGDHAEAQRLRQQINEEIKKGIAKGARPNAQTPRKGVGQALDPHTGSIRQAPKAARPGILDSPYVQP